MSLKRFEKNIQGVKGKLDTSVARHPYLIRHSYAIENSFALVEKDERVEFRASSLPFCALYHAYRLRLKNAGPVLEPAGDWRGNFYTEIGKSIHELWQHSLSLSALEADKRMEVKVFGSWECTACGKVKTEQFYPKRPCSCGKTLHWKYRELEFVYKGLGLHIDMLEYYPKVDEWVVSDLKTAGADNVTNTTRLEIDKNTFQIEAYCVILADLLDIHVSKYCLWYQTRDKYNKYYPHFVDWTPEREAKARRRMNLWTKTNKLIPGYTENPLAKNLVPLVETRPCTDQASYNLEMHPKFKWDNHTKKECPFKSKCMSHSGPEIIAKNIHALIEADVQEREQGQETAHKKPEQELDRDEKFGLPKKSLFEKVYKLKERRRII